MVSAPTGPNPGVVDFPVVVSPELDLPGHSGSTTEDILPTASQWKLGNLEERGKFTEEELKGNRVLDIPCDQCIRESCDVTTMVVARIFLMDNGGAGGRGRRWEKINSM